MNFYKVLTHDFRPPIQGGDPIWDGTLPFTLPRRSLDTSEATCASGWNFSPNLAAAFHIAGLWPDGRPSVPVRVEPSLDWIQRGDKCRASELTIVGVCSQATVHQAVLRLSELFGEHAAAMCKEQIAWRRALARPHRDEAKVEQGFKAALHARGLGDWSLRRFGNARAAWDARAAWAARAALTLHYAALKGWVDYDPVLLTTGIRDAYTAGLDIAVPTGPKELGWAMADAT